MTLDATHPPVAAVLGYGAVLLGLFYAAFSLAARSWLRLDKRALAHHIVLYMLFGPAGEEVVNTLWRHVSGTPLWEYRLYPIHGGNISLFFFQIWGIFGFYTFLRSQVFPHFDRSPRASTLLVFGVEAVMLELLVNVPHYLIFGSHIFYYFPANLGPLSHFSCLQVIPFYIAIAITTRRLNAVQEAANYMHLKVTLGFYLMVIAAYILVSPT